MATLQIKRITSYKELGKVELRGLDALECEAGGLTVEEALQRSIKDSIESYAIIINGELVLIGGYCPSSFMGETVRAWCLTTPDVNYHKVWFARASVRVINHLLKQYSAVEVYVWTGHRIALKWLKWLGFQIIKRDGEHFVLMRKER